MNRSGRSDNVLILSLLRLLTVWFPDPTPGIDLLAALTTAGRLRVGTWPKLNTPPEISDLGQTEDWTCPCPGSWNWDISHSGATDTMLFYYCYWQHISFTYNQTPSVSLGSQMAKSPPAMQETGVQSLGLEDKGMGIHSSILVWRIPWTEEPGGLPSMGSQRVRHDWATNPFTFTDT